MSQPEGCRTAASASDALAALWRDAAMPPSALQQLALTGQEPVLPSSFAVATALQAALGAAALAAVEVSRLRGGPVQIVRLDAADVAVESACRFTLDGRTPEAWDRFAGLYPCGAASEPGWVRLHTNFAHHRDGVLRLLGLPTDGSASRDDVAAALRSWSPEAFESAAAERGLVVAALRSPQAWARHPQAAAVAATPLVEIERIGDAPPRQDPALQRCARPLCGLRVLDLTRILAGPVAGRTLAAYGADVMLVNSPHLPNIEAIAETSRGKLSVELDLRSAAGAETLRGLLRDCDVFLQGYRPGGLADLGFGAETAARLRPGIVCLSLSAYGHRGPWAGRRGFDSLVQTATGLNVEEATAFGSDTPRALPLPALDYGAGYLLAFGAAAALHRQRREGGSWHVRVSLAGVGHWLAGLGRLAHGPAAVWPDVQARMEATDSGFGRLVAARHAVEMSLTPPLWDRPSMPPGSHPPVWPQR